MIFERPCRLFTALGLLITSPGSLAAQIDGDMAGALAALVGADVAFEAGLNHVRALRGTGTGAELAVMFASLYPVLGTTPSVGFRARFASISPAGWPWQGGKGQLIDFGLHLRIGRKVLRDRLGLNVSFTMERVDAKLTLLHLVCPISLDPPTTCLRTASKALGVGAGGGAQYRVARGVALSLGVFRMWSDLEITAENMIWIYSPGIAYRP